MQSLIGYPTLKGRKPMDAIVKTNRTLQVQRTIKALNKNNIDARFIETVQDVVPVVTSLLSKGESVAVGGYVELNSSFQGLPFPMRLIQ
jgi:hypothetical protein